jgi:hypothetical protein
VEGGGGGEQGGEMAQTIYAHINKWINNKEKNSMFSWWSGSSGRAPASSNTSATKKKKYKFVL